ncbi:acetyltransferase [Dehalococcoidia bacterium]|nr:acetyltransferase [Dehalococcoidia bacterium]
MAKIVVVGTGGLAREFTQWFSNQVEIVGYISTNPEEHPRFGLPGRLFEDESNIRAIGTNLAVIAIGAPDIRARVYRQLTEAGYQFPVLIHESSVVASNVDFADGVVISPMSCIGPNVRLGTLCYVNFCCGVGHDVQAEAFLQMNPGAQIGGFCRIGKHVLIGSGAVVRQGISIGNGATIASGSVVLSKVEENVTVMGNPAKRLRLLDRLAKSDKDI